MENVQHHESQGRHLEGRHPLDIQPLTSEKRNKQSQYEIFNPLPCKIYYCAPSSGGKSSAAIQAINALWPQWSRVCTFSATIHVDPSFEALVKRAKKLETSKGRDPDDPENEVAFESLGDLPRVMQQQAELIKEERSLGRKQLSQLLSLIHI